MITVPPGWLADTSNSHAPLWKLDLLDKDGALLREDIVFLDGGIELNEDGSTVASIDLPADPVASLLDPAILPMGNRLRFSYGLRHHPGAWAIIADLDIVSTGLSRPEDTWTLSLVDPAQHIRVDDGARGGLTLTGTSAQAVTAIIRRTLPAAAVNITGRMNSRPVPVDLAQERLPSDPWDLALQIAAAAGAQGWCNPSTRRFEFRDIPGDLLSSPVDRLAIGENLTAYTVAMDQTYNTAAVTYLSTADPPAVVIGLATDDRADSPVAVGRIGRRIVTGTTIQNVEPAAMPTQAEADIAAAAALADAAGGMRKTELQHPARPWLQPGDTIEVEYLGGPTELMRVASVGIPINQDNLQVTRPRTTEYKVA